MGNTWKRLDALIIRRYNVSAPEGPDPGLGAAPARESPADRPHSAQGNRPNMAWSGRRTEPGHPLWHHCPKAEERHPPQRHPPGCTAALPSTPRNPAAVPDAAEHGACLHRNGSAFIAPITPETPPHERQHPARPHARHAITQSRLPGPGRDGLSDGTPSGTGRTYGLRVQPHHGQGRTLAGRDRRQRPRRSPPSGPHPA